jgi:pimeloyl-ACP methyl ester carboxylesterase
MQARLNYVQCPDKDGGHRMAIWSHGPERHAHAVICVHGISRQGRDFDVLAQRLIGAGGQRCRVVSVDIVGRGMSDWLKDPMGYQLPQYAADMGVLLTMLRAEGVQTLDWIGTSLGGLIGLAVCAQPQAVSDWGLRKLVLNDVGPIIQPEAIARIRSYLGNDPRFDSEQQAIDYIWSISSSFGPHTSEQWATLTRPLLRPAENGKIKLHYDPQIAAPLRVATPESARSGEAMLWQLYDAITCETLLIRGADSDLITPQTAALMQSRGPKPRVVEFAGVGHAPTLVHSDQLDAVEHFIFG